MSRKNTSRTTIALALALAAGGAGHAQAPNDCGDAYWSYSLRCQQAANPIALLPQPPVAPPATPEDIKDYLRVELTGASERCLDGTVPIMWVDPAVGGPSNDWLITVTGGGSCAAEPDPITGDLEEGQTCLDHYLSGELSEMSSAGHPSTKNLGAESAGGSTGIYSPDSTENPVFARFNRVRIQKCSYDRYNGNSTRRVFAVHPTEGGIYFDMHQQGQAILKSFLQMLWSPTSLATHVAQGDTVATVNRVLPPLEQAERVVFVGHSGGAHGLMHNIDRIREGFLISADFEGDVRVVLDANFLPSLENEAEFDDLGPTGDIYAHVTTGTSVAAAPVTGAYSHDYYSDSASVYPLTYEAWSEVDDPTVDVYDESCVAAHPGEEERCADRFHVLFNHITTPLFVRQDLTDPNIEHVWDGQLHVLQWGEPGSYAHCPFVPGGSPCPPAITPDQHRERVLAQQEAFHSGLGTYSELASAFDTPGTGNPEDPTGNSHVPTLYLFMPDCTSHAGAYAQEPFQQTLVDRPGESTTMRRFLEEFVMEAPKVDVVERWVDGVDGVTTACPPQAASGRVPDGRFGFGAPLTLDKDAAGDVELSWSTSCVASDTDYAVYEGTLGDFASHAWVTCSTGGATTWTGTPAGGSSYYLIVPQGVDGEGSYGRDSDLSERGQGTRACLPQSVAPCI